MLYLLAMLHLLWGLFNIGIFIFFLVICFRATKLVWEKIGLLAAAVFVIGFLSFGHSNNTILTNMDKVKIWNFISKDSLNKKATFRLNIDLENNKISKCNLIIQSEEYNPELKNFPIEAYSSSSGFLAGTKWIPESIMVTEVKDQKFAYTVAGTIDWQLLGMTIYTQTKVYKGVATKS